jgi:hypothetical protein
MKINKNHFISTDNSVTQQAKSIYSSFINPFNYGILLNTDGKTGSLKINLSIDNQGFIHAGVKNCVAVTPDGSRIEVTESYFSGNELSAVVPDVSADQNAADGDEFLIALSVNSFERVPYGEPDPEEVPPRLPSVLPGYHLSVHRPEERASVSGGNSIIIGKIIFHGNKPELDDDYIPPCQAVYSHPKLVDFYSQLQKVMGQIEIDIVDILSGIKNKKQSTSIAATVAELGNSILNFMSVRLVEFRKIARYRPPVFIFELVAALARTINNSINKQASADKEELMNYVQDWSSLKQTEFENLIRNTIEYKYDHNNINEAINSLTPFINSISKIFNTLSNLDFIGKKKDMHIFVKEQKEKPGSSFLLD